MKLLSIRRVRISLLCFFVASVQFASAQYDQESYELLQTNPAKFREIQAANPGRSLNLKGADLSGMDLSGMNLSNADLSYCQLENTNLRAANLSHANLIGAKLMRADLTQANLAYADLNKANATGAIFKEASLKNTTTDFLMVQVGHQLVNAYVDPNGTVLPLAK